MQFIIDPKGKKKKNTQLPSNLLSLAKALRAGETTSADSGACTSLTCERVELIQTDRKSVRSGEELSI